MAAGCSLTRPVTPVCGVACGRPAARRSLLFRQCRVARATLSAMFTVGLGAEMLDTTDFNYHTDHSWLCQHACQQPTAEGRMGRQAGEVFHLHSSEVHQAMSVFPVSESMESTGAC
ncbi:uncharacterized protein LOC123514818 [Portunus trituberculatus]|uniref:uncharacterized protein LOC123514818 n=1 Tax=Portunus trituberculatus TaxID=210409 RepID=UPI001E1CBF24|nr:uncharacterized protein LOC123514818 [Portunus trituberculatus]